jgi:putative transposase
MCQLAQVSRVGYYRRFREQAPEAEAMEVRAAVQQIALEHRRRYGDRRITAELRRRGMAVHDKRVAGLMQEDNRLALRRKAWVATTNSGHELQVYLNLARRMEVNAPNQLGVADITYIRLSREFVYVALVVDGFSRRAVGWALERTLQTRLAVQALEMAIAQRQPRLGLVHHSDRGVQYASAEYAALRLEHGMTPSMSRPSNPFDNAPCESFIKTLKQEEIYCHPYRDLEDLPLHLREFIEEYYNRCRLHSALGYRTPAEFEAARLAGVPTTDLRASLKLSFQGMGRSIQPMNKGLNRAPEREAGEAKTGGLGNQNPRAHRLDESPADYSSASCSPAELASASSAGHDPRLMRVNESKKKQRTATVG